MEHWYVYYKCPGDSREDTIARVREMQVAVASQCDVRGRLLQRVDNNDANPDGITLMEIYEHIAASERFNAVLDDALARSGLKAELRSSRHTERFRDI